MKRYILAVFLIIFSAQVWAEEGQFENLVLSTAPINRSDIESIKRGAKFVATNCLSCHTFRYLRYDKLAQEAGITWEKMPLNVTSWPNGITPPDLSLEASVRGVDWIYTYLHSFYKDPSRPTGVNNLLVPNTGMSNILGPYQGEQELVNDPGAAGIIYHSIEWYGYLNLMKPGSMTSQEFDDTTVDVTNFLAYASEPFYIEQHRIGWWVICFLIVLTTMLYFLKKEYWKDVKKKKD